MLISGDIAVDKRDKNSAYEENPEKKITLTECWKKAFLKDDALPNENRMGNPLILSKS